MQVIFNTYHYEELCHGQLTETYDLSICNFSLLGKGSVENIFQHIHKQLNTNGCFVIQTLHPIQTCGEYDYKDGWREGSWQGFNQDFTDPAPWYFRTIESWKSLFENNKLIIEEQLEPINPANKKPASLIIIGRKLAVTNVQNT